MQIPDIERLAIIARKTFADDIFWDSSREPCPWEELPAKDKEAWRRTVASVLKAIGYD